jgi:hypothetical protein
MADVGGSHLNIGAQVEKRGHGHPRGSKNKSKDPAVVASSSVPAKRCPGAMWEVRTSPGFLLHQVRVLRHIMLLLLLRPGYIPSSASLALNAARFNGCR